MRQINIDPFFREKIPPLTDDEFSMLRENIISDGEVYEPLIVWGNTLIDGHNRWKIICENWELLKDKYRTKQMDFPDKWAAAEWMYKKQLGRRNLTDEQKTYAIGKMYEARKNTSGGDRGNQYTKVASAQNEHMANNNRRTADIIAEELGIGKETVKRAEKFAKGIDALREENPDAANKVLLGDTGVSKETVRDISGMSKEERVGIANQILSGEVIKKTNNSKGWTKADRNERAKTEAIIADMLDPSTVPKFTLDLLIDDIRLNAEQYINTLRNTLTDRNELLTPENRPVIFDSIGTYVINEIEKVRNLLK